MTAVNPDSVELRTRSDGGVYRWRQLFALLAVEGVDQLLLPFAVPSSNRPVLRSLSLAAAQGLDKIGSEWRSEAGEAGTAAFFAASERVILETLKRIEGDIGADSARAVHEYGILTDTAQEFAWKTLLRRLSKAEHCNTPGYTQPDIPLTDIEYRSLLDLVNTHLLNVSPQHIAERLGSLSSGTEAGALFSASDQDKGAVVDHLTDLTGWRAVNDLFQELRNTVAAATIDRLAAWAQLRAIDLGIDPALLHVS